MRAADSIRSAFQASARRFYGGLRELSIHQAQSSQVIGLKAELSRAGRDARVRSAALEIAHQALVAAMADYDAASDAEVRAVLAEDIQRLRGLIARGVKSEQ